METEKAAVPQLTMKENIIQTVKFFAISASAGVLQFGIYTLLTEALKWKHWPCYCIALMCSIVYNNLINRKYTFKSSANIWVTLAKICALYVVWVPLSTWVNAAITESITDPERYHTVRYICEIATLLINGVVCWAWYRFVVYRNSINSAVETETQTDTQPTE
ncbi:MAG: GtrA family protein [Oscillospiraceae bacterium]|nr:GtrA family protein [Oscillospiraceae bacterium]